MDDLILTSRLDSLEQSLKQIVDNSKWLRNCVLRRYEMGESGVSVTSWPGQVWDELDATVGSEARILKADLQDIRTLLSNAAQKPAEDAAKDITVAWEKYKVAYENSQEVFGECLEYIGGLAVRDRGFDRKICDIADHLIASCANDWNNLKWQSVTVLAAQERLGQTLARLIRLRFPEWTIWTLPFTAREFAFVALNANENRRLLEFVDKKAKELVEKEPRLAAARKDGANNLEDLINRAQRHARKHIHELIADAFATYTMGPAHACAAIMLRFNPIDGGPESYDHPTDAKRAEVVLGMLELMNEKAEGEPPYAAIIKRLRDEWNTARARSIPSDTHGTASSTRLEEMIDVKALMTETLDVFSNTVRESARFPDDDAEHGWLKAKDWSGKLVQILKAGRSDLDDDLIITSTSKLRDALNAAWLCRIYAKAEDRIEISKISEASRALCVNIIRGPKPNGPTGFSPTVKPPGPGGVPPGQESFNKVS